MGNQDNCFPLIPKPPNNLQKEADFLRCEYRGRLIKNQDFRLTIKHFQNLYTLLHGNAHIFNDILGIDFQSVSFGKLSNLLLRLLHIYIRKKPEPLIP